jgi:integrase
MQSTELAGTLQSWHKLKALALNAVRSPHTKRLYSYALDQFHLWYFADTRPAFSKAVVQEYRCLLEQATYSSSTISVHLAALRRLALEAADNGFLDPQVAAAVCRVRSPRKLGQRVGNWLSLLQARALLDVSDTMTMRGVRDRAVIALLMGSGLRRSEIASLRAADLQTREGRWLIPDLHGKHGRLRTVPVPIWVMEIINRWIEAAHITDGKLFRRVNKSDAVARLGMSSQAIYEVIKIAGQQAGFQIAPHDLRRTFAKLAYAADPRIEQIQLVLGHASIRTTELYLGTAQDLQHSPGDRIPLCEAKDARLSELPSLQ